MPKVRQLVSRFQETDFYFRLLSIENKPKKVVITLIAIVALFAPYITDIYVETILIFILLYTLVGFGIYLLIGHAGIVSLGQVGFYCIGAYLSAIISIEFGISPWLSLCCAAIVNAGIAYLIGKPFFEAGGMSLAVITLAFSLVVYITVARLPITGGHDGISGIPRFSIGSLKFGDTLCYYLLLAVVGIALLFSYNLTEKKIGRGLRAMNEFGGGDEIATISSGIDVTKLKTQLFVISAVLASFAGSIFAHWLTTINPDFFGILVTFVFVMIVGIGGFRSIWGALIGAVFYFGLKEMLSVVMHGQKVLGGEIIVFGLIFILILIFLPGGITSLPDEWREWRHEWQLKRGKKQIVSHEDWLK